MRKLALYFILMFLFFQAQAVAGPMIFDGGSGSGDMTQAVYDTNADSMIDADKINGSIDATKIGAGGVTSTEFGYIGTLSSDIQTQVTAKVSKTDAAFTASTELTISGGAITRTQALHTVDTEADAASDNLDTISGGADGNIQFIRANHTDRTVVVTESGNIVIPQGTTISLDDNIKTLLLVYDGTLTKWVVVNVLPDSLSISEITLGGIILGDSTPDAAGEFAYDGDLKYYDAVGAKTVAALERANSFTGVQTFSAGHNMMTSDADPGTTAGNTKHDSTDTGSNSGGTAKWYDGAQVRSFVDTGTNYTIITKTEFLPIGWLVDGATAPTAIAAVTGKEVMARSFTEADDGVYWWIVPNDYVGGIKYRVFYALSANANADDTAVFSMAGGLVANSGDLDGSAGTALVATDELTTDDDQYQVMISDYTAESNADWSLSAGGLARFNFSHAAASDMAGAGEPLVIGIEIKYKAKIIGFGGY